MKLCDFSELANEHVTSWISMFQALKSEWFSQNGLGKWALEKAEGLTPEVIGLFFELNGILAEHQEGERKRRRIER